MLAGRVLILTDCTDVAAAEIRLAIAAHLSDPALIHLVDPPIAINRWSILNGAFVNRLLADVCPPDSILYTVLNPVRDQPERVFGFTRDRGLAFVGRDTGVFSWLVRDLGCKALYHFPKVPYVPFGGRQIYPRVVARLMEGTHPSHLGAAAPTLTVREVRAELGQIVHIDNFGICKLFGRFPEGGIQDGTDLVIICEGSPTRHARYSTRLMAANDGELVVYDGSSLGGLVEIAIARDHAASQLGLKLGDVVSILLDGKHLLRSP